MHVLLYRLMSFAKFADLPKELRLKIVCLSGIDGQLALGSRPGRLCRQKLEQQFSAVWQTTPVVRSLHHCYNRRGIDLYWARMARPDLKQLEFVIDVEFVTHHNCACLKWSSAMYNFIHPYDEVWNVVLTSKRGCPHNGMILHAIVW